MAASDSVVMIYRISCSSGAVQDSINARCRRSQGGRSGLDKYPKELRWNMQVREKASMIGKRTFDNGRLVNWLFGSNRGGASTPSSRFKGSATLPSSLLGMLAAA